MDTYFKKTRRPIGQSLKRPPQSVTPPKPAKITNTPTTPPNARLTRPLHPPPVKRKGASPTVKQLFNKVRPLESQTKITSGPLKGVSSSLLDIIRAKEAAAKSEDPEREQQLRLLGIAPEVVRIVPTVFTASKREVMLYDKVVDKCFKGLKSNYTTETIIQCLHLMDKIAPEWISTVEISKGRFMRINRDKYTIPLLLDAIKNFKLSYPSKPA